MTKVYEFSEYKREDLIYNFITLTDAEVAEKKANFARYEAEKASKAAESDAKSAKEKAE